MMTTDRQAKEDKQLVDQTVRRIRLASEVVKDMDIKDHHTKEIVWKMALSSIDNQLIQRNL